MHLKLFNQLKVTPGEGGENERIFNDGKNTAQIADASIGSTDSPVKTVIMLGDWGRTSRKNSLAIMHLFTIDF